MCRIRIRIGTSGFNWASRSWSGLGIRSRAGQKGPGKNKKKFKISRLKSSVEGWRQVKVLIKHLAIFFLFPSKKFLPISFKIQLLETSPQKQKEQIQMQLDFSFFLMSFPSCTFWIRCNLLLLFTFCQVCLLVKETAEIETGMAEKYNWDQANIRQKLGLVWINIKKISQIIKDQFYLPLNYFIAWGFLSWTSPLGVRN